ncbi:indolepyruvate ferredoxin oxidoreductase family protein [Seongchinamella unica]|uniref:Indolepyruvate ferredoxin oxidoreductase family protein n=1 Tax=Seongchinamella unica TaxID=2547392 RepID=A0A4R5LRE4_9GAMM|nr:indolepyruvate ferredoxin oxidoreductase family protein [Seongchinamella unica]TDG13421.1 indolepyruvate ferredoxin oxidoreductase family protein [Seongchinamella unica]
MTSDNPVLQSVSLADKYDKSEGRVFISGTQALARLALVQREIDTRAGLNTRGFISGYRGSPLGTLDSVLWREHKRLDAAGVVFQPGVNEDLAATAVWGSQQLDFFPDPQVDGVYALWYGKAPGVDRSADAIRHGNNFGTHKHGGVLVVVGDDHPGKSSTVVNQSEPMFAAMQIPVLYPSDVQEIIDFGLLGWQLSRYCGLWVGLKTVNETVEQTQTVTVHSDEFSAVWPDRGLDADNVNIKSAFNPQALEVTVKRVRLPLVNAFVRANGIDKERIGGKGGLGIVTSGKSYSDVIQAFSLLGLDSDAAAALGIAIYKVGCIWPLEPEGMKEFAQGRPELLFVEEKSPMLEPQVAQLLINAEQKPRLVGKQDEHGSALLPSDVQLEPTVIADVIFARLDALAVADPALRDRHAALMAEMNANRERFTATALKVIRTPYFCSGCPHNTSTRLPEGSMAMAGIGCHGMAGLRRADTLVPTHMGGEGVNWTGVAPFSGTEHMFQNIGDGTYFHSGLMAIRAAVASGANITYKILFNDAVAMTGGQPIDGPISVATMASQVLAEGVRKVVVVSDQPEKFRGQLPRNVALYPREELDLVQRELREVKGTTALIYEQTCAAEKRRRRKRGTFPNPAKRMFINDAVCEGCGDCSEQSTCVSIQPRETPFGTKRQVDQSSCNKDYSCAKGFCPSFVTVLGSEPRKPSGVALEGDLFADLPMPARAELTRGNVGIMIAGIGGTGVITVGAVIGMAAHLEGNACSIYDMTGLSQKNGAVYSHLRIAERQEDLAAQRIGAGEADVVLGFDLLAALSGDAGTTYALGRTRVVGNSKIVPTIDFQFNRDMTINEYQVEADIATRAGTDNTYFVDATDLALKLLGDTIGANMFLVGYAAQLGLLPVTVQALEEAIRLNGTAIPFNLQAFALGRLYAHSPDAVTALLPEQAETVHEETLEELIASRAQHLVDYQNQAWSQRFLATVDRVRAAETAIDADSTALTRAVAANLSKLMSYKDEYEVGRLYSDPAFKRKLDATFEPGYTLKFNLAPPMISRINPSTGRPMKREFGQWILPGFSLLARLKGLRGTPLDIFGYNAERRLERQLIRDYEEMLDTVLPGLDEDNLEAAVALASLPDDIRGFGHVKEKAVQEVGVRKEALLQKFAA